jgi:hypothetical protein
MKNILKESKRVLISPVGIKFSHNFFNMGYKLISLVFMNKKTEIGNIKLSISNLPENFLMNSSIEIIKINQNFINENTNVNILEQINNLVFCLVLIEKIFGKFPNYLNPIGKELYNYYIDSDNDNNKEKRKKFLFFY